MESGCSAPERSSEVNAGPQGVYPVPFLEGNAPVPKIVQLTMNGENLTLQKNRLCGESSSSSVPKLILALN
ncbi:hypothetical protein EU545_01050 [Candidatus Thorarchaeota archaeon]|nr:MAG: hypothetical protein EU545_01050 [Candidatus Thorarchaeota archaeon]